MTERGWRWVAIGVASVVVAAQWIRIAVNPVGDFRLHWVWGARFLHRQFLYAGGTNIPYLPAWAMAFAPLSLLPVRLAQSLLYPFALLATWAVLAIVERMADVNGRLDSPKVFWAAVVAIALASRYLLRDLSEAGPNVLLMALAWIGIWAWWTGRSIFGGVALGAAIALKPTAALFLVYFALRRQSRFAVAATVAAAVFTLLPAAWQGPALFGTHVSTWARVVWAGVASGDPRVGVLGLETIGNVSLRPALARYLMHIPEGADDQGRFVHRWNVDILTLSPQVAAPIVAAVILAVAGAMVWSLRRSRADPRTVVVWDSAAVAILALLLSPITWRQHCVAILPACYLIARMRLTGTRVPPVASFAIGALVVVSLVFSRGVMGDTVSSLVHAYYLHTIALLLLLAGVIACRNRALQCRPAVEPRSS